MQLGSVSPISDAASAKQDTGSHINLSTPAGWALLYFFASVVILGLLFLNV